jgi:hypothetical protein
LNYNIGHKQQTIVNINILGEHMNQETTDKTRKNDLKKKPRKIPTSQKIVGYFFVLLGVFVLIVLLIGFSLRGMPEGGGGVIIVFIALPAGVIHGIRILKAKVPVNVWSWDLEEKK